MLQPSNPSLWSRSTSLFFSEAVGPFGVRRKIVIWKASPVSEKGALSAVWTVRRLGNTGNGPMGPARKKKLKQMQMDGVPWLLRWFFPISGGSGIPGDVMHECYSWTQKSWKGMTLKMQKSVATGLRDLFWGSRCSFMSFMLFLSIQQSALQHASIEASWLGLLA